MEFTLEQVAQTAHNASVAFLIAIGEGNEQKRWAELSPQQREAVLQRVERLLTEGSKEAIDPEPKGRMKDYLFRNVVGSFAAFKMLEKVAGS